ncbi:hypothetical protein [Bradyrhizobium sp. USDA 10063]
MARFRCAACGREGEFVYDPQRHECPRCSSKDVVFALAIDELSDEIIEAIASAEPLDDPETDEN